MTQYRLLFVEDWSRYEMYMIGEGVERIDMLRKLCDYSIQRLYKYCDLRIVVPSYMYEYYYRLQSQCLEEVFRRKLSLDILCRENDVIPLAPLYKYKSESWITHPRENLF